MWESGRQQYAESPAFYQQFSVGCRCGNEADCFGCGSAFQRKSGENRVSVYLTDPHPYVPEKKPGRGRPPCRYQSDIGGIAAEAVVRECDESGRKEYCLRRETESEKRRKVIVGEVHTRNGEDGRAGKEKLIISENPDGTEIKYPLCNDRHNRYRDSGYFICGCNGTGQKEASRMRKANRNGRISGEDTDSAASSYLTDNAGITVYDRAEIQKQRAGSFAFLQ